MSFPQDVKTQALFSSGRHCCICHKFCGIKMECHHIIHTSEKGENTLDNCIPLCFDCHADQKSYDSKHPKGTKYSREELKLHRDNWYEKVKNNLGSGDQNHLEQDKSTIASILKILTPNGTIRTLREANFGYPQEDAEYDELYRIAEFYKNEPWNEFFDSDLESIRSNLLETVKKFNSLRGIKTFTHVRKGYFEVPSEWEETRTEEYHKIISDFHDMIDTIIENYDSLIKLSRSKLGI
jgi:hypothetical protein